MHMDVAGYARTPCFAEVNTEIETCGIVDLAEDLFDALGEENHLLCFVGWESCERIDVAVWDDEDMASGIGEGVET